MLHAGARVQGEMGDHWRLDDVARVSGEKERECFGDLESRGDEKSGPVGRSVSGKG